MFLPAAGVIMHNQQAIRQEAGEVHATNASSEQAPGGNMPMHERQEDDVVTLLHEHQRLMSSQPTRAQPTDMIWSHQQGENEAEVLSCHVLCLPAASRRATQSGNPIIWTSPRLGTMGLALPSPVFPALRMAIEFVYCFFWLLFLRFWPRDMLPRVPPVAPLRFPSQHTILPGSLSRMSLLSKPSSRFAFRGGCDCLSALEARRSLSD